MSERLTITAPAKVNLALSVGSPESTSGLHPICSWMITVDLCDELELTQLDPGSLSRYAVLWHDAALQRSDIDWSIRDDLAVRAHLALEQHVGQALPLQAAIRKRIPVGGGLGGGSADAAAMLVGCRALFKLEDRVTQVDLVQIAQGLGSDVPFMLEGGSALVGGIGEQIELLAVDPDCHLVLILMDAACPTGPTYAQFDRMGAPGLRPAAVREVAQGTRGPFNDLTEAARALAPALVEAADAVEQLVDRDVHVSGSGATLFIQCASEIEATAIAREISSELEMPALVAAPALRRMNHEAGTS